MTASLSMNYHSTTTKARSLRTAPIGHTPSMAGTFRKKSRTNSGKSLETPSELFLEFPSRVRLGTLKHYDSRHLKPSEDFQNSPPHRLTTQLGTPCFSKVVLRGPLRAGHGLPSRTEGIPDLILVVACAMTTKFLDNKFSTFNFFWSWRFPWKTVFSDDFPLCPQPPPPPKSANFIFIVVSPSLIWKQALWEWKRRSPSNSRIPGYSRASPHLYSSQVTSRARIDYEVQTVNWNTVEFSRLK